jgi:hypothetical protein
MSWTTRRFLPLAAFFAVPFVLLVAAHASAAIVNSTVFLGPANGAGNIGSFSANVSLGAGSALQLGPSAVAGNYKQRTVVFGVPINTNIGFSAQNATGNLTLNPSTIGVSTANNTGTANLDYDNFSPGSPLILQSFSSVLSDGVVTNMQINSTSIPLTASGISLSLVPQFNGTIKNISFSSTGNVDVSGGGGLIPGNYSVTLNGSVTGTLFLLGANIGSTGTLFTLPTDTQVTFAGTLPVGVALSDTGIPFGGGLTTVNKNTMLAAFGANLGSLQLPFSFVAPLATSTNFSVPSNQSGVTSIRIQNTTLTANIILSNVQYNETGKVPNTLVPEPSTLALGSLALVGLLGMVARRKAAR